MRLSSEGVGAPAPLLGLEKTHSWSIREGCATEDREKRALPAFSVGVYGTWSMAKARQRECLVCSAVALEFAFMSRVPIFISETESHDACDELPTRQELHLCESESKLSQVVHVDNI